MTTSIRHIAIKMTENVVDYVPTVQKIIEKAARLQTAFGGDALFMSEAEFDAAVGMPW